MSVDLSQDYAYACQRAELLGLEIPDEEEWKSSQKSQDTFNDDNEAVKESMAQNLEGDDETAKRVSGGLDELNSILNATQRKLNRFKTVCGSLGTLLRVRVGSRGGTPNHQPTEPNCNVDEILAQDEIATIETTDVDDFLRSDAPHEDHKKNTPQRATDINQKMGSHLDKLDSLITKAENAQYSMQSQTKQMRSFLK